MGGARPPGAPFLSVLRLSQIKTGATRSMYPHQRSQTGFSGETYASSPIVLAQFLKLAFEPRIGSDGMRRSMRSAIAMMTANKIHPARRHRANKTLRFDRNV